MWISHAFKWWTTWWTTTISTGTQIQCVFTKHRTFVNVKTIKVILQHTFCWETKLLHVKEMWGKELTPLLQDYIYMGSYRLFLLRLLCDTLATQSTASPRLLPSWVLIPASVQRTAKTPGQARNGISQRAINLFTQYGNPPSIFPSSSLKRPLFKDGSNTFPCHLFNDARALWRPRHGNDHLFSTLLLAQHRLGSPGMRDL